MTETRKLEIEIRIENQVRYAYCDSLQTARDFKKIELSKNPSAIITIRQNRKGRR